MATVSRYVQVRVQPKSEIAGLKWKRLPLAEAAAACGFADQSHMTRLFVREYGVSPRMVADAAG